MAEEKKSLIQLSDLWRWDGQIDRLPYAVIGASLATVKFGVDTWIASTFFHRAWSWLNYISPGQAIDVLAMKSADQTFYASMLFLSLPFIWIGIVLTMRRLRSAGLPIWLCKLFFLPVVNLFVFATLSVLPSQSEKSLLERDLEQIDSSIAITPNDAESKTTIAKEEPKNSTKSRIPPGTAHGAMILRGSDELKLAAETRWSDAVYAVVTTVPAAAVLTFLATSILKTYGWSLFIGVPFAVGMASAYLYGRHHSRGIGECLLVSSLAVSVLGLAVFFVLWEGVLCLVMAAPLVYILALMGSLLGYNLQKKKHLLAQTRLILTLLLIILPLSMGADYADKAQFPVCAVHTTCKILAPPETVWKYIIAFPSLPAPTEPMFKAGIAYPIGATIDGQGRGAVRRCKFSTGTFVEPINVWDKPRLLQFGVWSQPEPMKELSWVHDLQPAHLNGYLNVHKGEFKLTPVIEANGSTNTLVVGTTWYDNHMWPASYWRLYADNIMHTIHTRVLNHIKTLAEIDQHATSKIREKPL